MTSRIRSVRLDDDVYNALKKMSERPYTPSWHIQEALRQYLAGKAPKKEVAPKKPKVIDDGLFEAVWEAYGKKGNKKTSRAKFNKLDIVDQNLIYRHIPAYVLSTPDKQYRKNFETYLNQECWNDEVITNENNQPGRTTAGRKLSPAERSRAAAEANRAARARDRGDLDNVAGDIRQLNVDPIRGCDAGVVGAVIEGDYTTSDKGWSE